MKKFYHGVTQRKEESHGVLVRKTSSRPSRLCVRSSGTIEVFELFIRKGVPAHKTVDLCVIFIIIKKIFRR